jgi:hypothetical protein
MSGEGWRGGGESGRKKDIVEKQEQQRGAFYMRTT